MPTIPDLQQRFGIAGVVHFVAGPANFLRVEITGPLANASVYLYGAHVAVFQPHGQRPVLFVSEKANFVPGKSIRGGVPVIFPWFGPHPTNPQAPAHGLARLVEWTLASVTQHPDGTVELIFHLDAHRLQHRIVIGRTLEMALTVENPTSSPFRFEEALHTYFAVSDIRQCTVTGLENAQYDSAVEGVTGESQGPAPIAFTAETDRLYLNTRSTCVLHDPGWRRQIVVEKSGSDSTVVWNPWIAKSKAMPDFGDDEWLGMLCIETVNARVNAITLAPGRSHAMRQIVRVEE